MDLCMYVSEQKMTGNSPAFGQVLNSKFLILKSWIIHPAGVRAIPTAGEPSRDRSYQRQHVRKCPLQVHAIVTTQELINGEWND